MTLPDHHSHDSFETTRAAEELLEQIRVSRDSDSIDGKTVGAMIDNLRRLLDLTAGQFAEGCQVSLSTYYRWINGDKPPRHRIDRFSTLFQKETPEERARDSIISGDRRLTIRPLEQLLDRQLLCRRIWSLKHALPFRAAKPGLVRSRLFEFLADPQNAGQFHCVFFGPSQREDDAISKYAGLESFGEFKRKLFETNPDCASKLRGWLVTSKALAFSLGLTDLYLGVNILEYDPIKTAERSSLEGRDVDIFFEVPLAVYLRDDHHQLQGGEESRWLELAPEKSSWDWQQRGELFSQLEAGKLDKSEVHEFLADPEEIRAFKPKRWLD